MDQMLDNIQMGNMIATHRFLWNAAFYLANGDRDDFASKRQWFLDRLHQYRLFFDDVSEKLLSFVKETTDLETFLSNIESLLDLTRDRISDYLTKINGKEMKITNYYFFRA